MSDEQSTQDTPAAGDDVRVTWPDGTRTYVVWSSEKVDLGPGTDVEIIRRANETDGAQ
ncbi:hypothetical protein [Amycolatopsis antarctica]|uniref:hypothetical protein n=1 Tax=Amycolatopsis antarctica TaxID=1854586 RepID=UPI0013FDD539|nr:hypothetical protein [Amycolatopsis antarctica]